MIYPVKLKIEYGNPGSVMNSVESEHIIECREDLTHVICYMDMIDEHVLWCQSDLIEMIDRLEVAEVSEIREGNFTISLWG